jgi:hypothetical protein
MQGKSNMDFDKDLVACFDLGDILGEARFSPPPPEFVGFIVFWREPIGSGCAPWTSSRSTRPASQ